MKQRLLIVAHCPSPNTQRMAQAIYDGAMSVCETGEVSLKSPFDCDAEAVLSSDALILFTTENFGYMSGALKDFFERIYYPCLDDKKRNQAKPFALVIKAGLDGTGTNIAANKITTGLRWKAVAPLTLCKGEFNESFCTQCYELGQTMQASLEAGII